MKNKRKRYRQTKKRRLWEDKLRKEVEKKWKARTLAYNAEVEQEKLDQEREERLRQSMQEYRKTCMEKDRQCRQEILFVQETVYKEVSTASQDEKSGNALLLPTVSVPEDTNCDLKKLGIHITGIDRVAITSAIQEERQRTKKALERARFYRDLAERIKAKKREEVNELNHKIELVRNYWRNKVYEGSSRAGRLVQKALLSKKQF